MKKIIKASGVLFMLVVAASDGIAVEVPELPVGGVFDLADPAAWGEIIPSSADDVIIKRSGITFVAGEDVAFSRIQLQKSSGGATNVFRLSEGRKVALSGNFDSYYGKAHTTLDGGVWTIGGELKCAAGRQGRDCAIVLSNSVAVTAKNVSAGGGSVNGCLLMTDGATATASEPSLLGVSSTNALFRIDDGAKLTGTGDFWLAGTACGGCRVEVDGAGTEIAGTAAFRSHGGGSTGNSLVVSDKALFGFSGRSTRFAEGTACSNDFVFTSGAQAYFGTATLNYGDQSFANDIEVSDSAILDFRTDAESSGNAAFTVGGLGGSEVLISNATLRCSMITIGTTQMSTGNRLRITGPEAVIETSLESTKTYNLFGKGGGNEIVLDDKAGWTLDNHLVYGSYIEGSGSGTNTLHVANGAKMTVHACWIGTPHGGNTLKVTGGGEFVTGLGSETESCTALAVHAPGTSVVLSNGTVRTLGENTSITFGEPFNYYTRTESPGDRLVIRGTNSLIKAAASLSFGTQAVISFDVPPGGYVQAPLQSRTLTLTGDCVIEVACDAFRKGLARPARLVLAQTEDGVTVPDAVLAAANAALAGVKTRLRVSDDGTALLLDVRPDRGLSVVLR